MFTTLIMESGEREEPLFDPVFLGDKYPVVDHLVRLVGAKIPSYFFVQVRATARGYQIANGVTRLLVQVSKKEVNQLAALPAPTYVVGVSKADWKAYILSVNEPRNAISTLPTTYPLTKANMQRLWEEVSVFWATQRSQNGEILFLGVNDGAQEPTVVC